MPHWTLPKPNDDNLAAAPVKAITALQAELDKLFERPGGLSAGEIDVVAQHVATFYADFEAHLKTVRARLTAG